MIFEFQNFWIFSFTLNLFYSAIVNTLPSALRVLAPLIFLKKNCHQSSLSIKKKTKITNK